MAKSTRSKVKRAHRSKKRQEGVYAATEAARLERLSARLSAVISIPEQLIGDGDSGLYLPHILGFIDPRDITLSNLNTLCPSDEILSFWAGYQ